MHDRSDPQMQLSLSLSGDQFTCNGPRRDVRDFLDVWLKARTAPSDPNDQAAIHALTARAKRANDSLSADVAATTPKP